MSKYESPNLSPREKHAVAIYYIENNKNQTITWRKLYIISESIMENRNELYCITKRHRFFRVSGTGRDSSFQLPIDQLSEYLPLAEREKGVQFSFIEKHGIWKLPPTTDKGAAFLLPELEKLIGSGGAFFYGVEGKVPDGPLPLKHYLKIGTSNTKPVGRFSFRGKNDLSHSQNSTLNGIWSIPLNSIIRDGKEVSGKVAEDLFEQAFGSHCSRWQANKRMLTEYFEVDDVISAIMAKLMARFPHPKTQI